MSTATDTITVDDATAELDAARRQRDSLRAAVAAGDTSVGPAELAEVNAVIEHAELRLELAQDAAAQRATDRRAARVAELVDALGDRAEVQRIVELEQTAAEAVSALLEACTARRAAAQAAADELERIGGDLGDRVDARTLGARTNVKAVDGRALHDRSPDWPLHMLHSVIREALDDAGMFDNDLHRLVAKSTVGGIHDPHTYAQQLRRQLDELTAADRKGQ